MGTLQFFNCDQIFKGILPDKSIVSSQYFFLEEIDLRP